MKEELCLHLSINMFSILFPFYSVIYLFVCLFISSRFPPAEAKRSAALRIYTDKVELMTMPELKKEIEKYKKRREMVSE